MITLYTFGPGFGLPDPSPFVTKAELLLKMSGLPFTTDATGFRKAPKGKLPYLRDGDAVVCDSTFIRWHLESKHGINFDGELDSRARAIGWAAEKMLEDHLYWAALDARWNVDANFARGPARFFDAAPAPVRPIIKALVRRGVRTKLRSQGFGKHTRAEIEALGCRSIRALSDILGENAYLLGPEPCGADATAYAFVAGVLCPAFETPLRTAAEECANLVEYESRMRCRYYLELPALGAAL